MTVPLNSYLRDPEHYWHNDPRLVGPTSHAADNGGDRSEQALGGGGGGNNRSANKNSNAPAYKPPHPGQPIANPALLKQSELYKDVDPSQFKLVEYTTNGSFNYTSMGRVETIDGKAVKKGREQFLANPAKYIGMSYQTSMYTTNTWEPSQQTYDLIHRDGTDRLRPVAAKGGWMTVLMYTFEQLPPFPNNELPDSHKDKYTDRMIHQGKFIHSANNKPILPGRGMGVADTPLLKVIGDVDPSDIHQGQVGDCWLLSAISALAEFDGAVKRLFRKTPNLDQMPTAGKNMYTVTLWDLETWQEVDIVMDERLAAAPNAPGTLLASKPSEDGELWVCYLEKALAIHCGGWDEITGGQCTHAWALMTGCKHQYTISRNSTGRWACRAKFDPSINDWAPHHNSPHHKGDRGVWQCAWPEVGGGGSSETELTDDELFERMFAWDQVNYIVGAGTMGTSDKKSSGGMVDNHAYSVIEAVQDAAGTGIDLFKVCMHDIICLQC